MHAPIAPCAQQGRGHGEWAAVVTRGVEVMTPKSPKFSELWRRRVPLGKTNPFLVLHCYRSMLCLPQRPKENSVSQRRFLSNTRCSSCSGSFRTKCITLKRSHMSKQPATPPHPKNSADGSAAAAPPPASTQAARAADGDASAHFWGSCAVFAVVQYMYALLSC